MFDTCQTCGMKIATGPSLKTGYCYLCSSVPRRIKALQLTLASEGWHEPGPDGDAFDLKELAEAIVAVGTCHATPTRRQRFLWEKYTFRCLIAIWAKRGVDYTAVRQAAMER